MNTHKILLVDASGSMSSYVKDTRKSIYSIIKELDQNTHLTLVFFDTTEYKIVADDYVLNIAPELGYTYKALSGTPITDSVYKAIEDITNDISNIEQLSEPHKFIIFTDGCENDSTHVTAKDLGRAIEHFTDNFRWNFQFIGPKSCTESIQKYTNEIKIKKENVTLYASMSEGLTEMKRKTINR